MCGSCQRYQLPCNYDRHNAKTAPKAENTPFQPDEDPSANDSNTGSLNYHESKERRLLELRLLLQYTTKTSVTMDLRDPSVEKDLIDSWPSDLAIIAFDNDALLNIVFAFSALHLAKCNPLDLDAVDLHRRYLDLALREHSNDVTHLTKMNADAACLTSSIIRCVAFAILQERPRVPYTSPMQWLQMTRGTGNVIKEAWSFIEDDDSSAAFRLVKRTPIIKDPEELFQEGSRQNLLHLLYWTRSEHTLEAWSAEIEEAYSSTVSYIGSVQSLIENSENLKTVCRILLMFPYLIQKGFIDLVQEQRPRALVILAHYFGLLTRFKYVWFIGDAGSREIRAIQAVLPEEWQDLMAWPLQTLGEESQHG